MLIKIWNWLFPKPLKTNRVAMKIERAELHNRLDRAIVRADSTLTRLRQLETQPCAKRIR